MAQTTSVITIGRQYGSGGRVIGEMLAKKLEIPYYDKEILTEAAKDSGICEELFEKNDEKPTRSLLFSMVTGAHMMTDVGGMYMDMPLNHKIFLAQFDAIRRVASQGPCVIVGRCADYVLRDQSNVINVFLRADLATRVARAIERGATPSKAEDIVKRYDRQRSSYYNYYATSTWGDVNHYDLCLDTGKLGMEGSAELIMAYIRMREEAIRTKKV